MNGRLDVARQKLVDELVQFSLVRGLCFASQIRQFANRYFCISDILNDIKSQVKCVIIRNSKIVPLVAILHMQNVIFFFNLKKEM